MVSVTFGLMKATLKTDFGKKLKEWLLIIIIATCEDIRLQILLYIKILFKNGNKDESAKMVPV
jgi:hypothetical protein